VPCILYSVQLCSYMHTFSDAVGAGR